MEFHRHLWRGLSGWGCAIGTKKNVDLYLPILMAESGASQHSVCIIVVSGWWWVAALCVHCWVSESERAAGQMFISNVLFLVPQLLRQLFVSSMARCPIYLDGMNCAMVDDGSKARQRSIQIAFADQSTWSQQTAHLFQSIGLPVCVCVYLLQSTHLLQHQNNNKNKHSHFYTLFQTKIKNNTHTKV